ncbi:MAG: restriction endonuclease subunit S [Clostridia bacterium]|nr:restriction endonuclease subunit S [Clostridia bacterium]
MGIYDGYISECNTFYNEIGLAQSRIWTKGTLCLTIAANIADVGILEFNACFPDSVVGFSAFNPIDDNRYFLYMLMAYKAILDSKATKSAQKNINLDTIASLAYPLPPLAEQQRIVDRVNELIATCDRLTHNK